METIMKSTATVVLPHRSSFAVYTINKDYLIINPSINFWFKLSKEQLLAFSLLDGKSNLNELLRKVAEGIPLSLQETCKMFLRTLASNFPVVPLDRPKPTKLSLLYFVLTNNCNSSCVYCFRNSGNSHIAMIDKELAEQAIMSFKKISSANAAIVYTGGEPTCHPNLIEIADCAREEGFRNTLQTNGLLISRNVDLYARVFDTIQISLDSTNEETNDWLRGKRGHLKVVSETIKLLKQYSVTVRLSATITKKNLKDIARIRDAFPGIQFQYTPMLRIGRAKSTATLSLSPTEFLKHLSETPERVNECVINVPNFGEKNITIH